MKSRRGLHPLFLLLIVFSMLVMPLFPAGFAVAQKPDDLVGFSEHVELAPSTEDVTPTGLVDLAPGVSETGLYIVQLRDPSLARYEGDIASLSATSPRVTGEARLDVSAPASVAYLSYLVTQQQRAVDAVETALQRSVDVAFQYLNVLNAFAVNLTPEEAARVAELPQVAAVYPDRLRELTTDVGPALMGAPTFWEGSYGLDQHRGEGVIVGVLDTGINPTHPSFAATDAEGYTHTNPYGSGNFVGVCDPDEPDQIYESICNDKLVGAWSFNEGPNSGNSAVDWNDHGSHVAGTIAGNLHEAQVDVGSQTFARIISGVAPRANIISYKVCDPSCPSVSSVAAIDQAIADGVDVLNYSISGSDSPWTDSVDLAFLDAYAAGIFVSASAGNSGPDPSTVAKTGPWNASVAASTHNRVIANTVDVTAPAQPAELQGLAAVPGSGPAIQSNITAPITWAGSVDETNPRGCNAFPAGSFNDAIALIERGDCTFATKVNGAATAGAVAVIVYNHVGGPPTTMGGLEATTTRAVMVDVADGQALVQYSTVNPGTHVRINAAASVVVNDAWQNIVAGFSSRGPSQWDLLKPDYTAPGVNILAAGYNGAGDYVFMQGTSMSSPHGAGAAALLVQRHPDWTPAEIKSALAMTANPNLLNDDGVNPATNFAMGSGRIDLSQAALVGLVMDETVANYNAANPASGGSPRDLNQPSMVDLDCVGSCSWTRTVKSVLDEPATYQVSTDGPAGMNINVTPSSFTLGPGATQELQISADVSALPGGVHAFGGIRIAEVVPAQSASVLLSESFTGEAFPPAGWSHHRLQGAGPRTWGRSTSVINSAPASAMREWSYPPDGYQDDWLVTPALNPLPNAILRFADRGYWMMDYVYSGVWISTDSCDPADGDFVELREIDDSVNNSWRQVPAVDLDAYAGQTACLAFRYGGEDGHSWWIDDVVVQVVEAPGIAEHRLPVVVLPVAPTPEIGVSPTELSAVLGADETTVETLTISNAGAADLNWEIVESIDLDAEPRLPMRPLTPVVEGGERVALTIGDNVLTYNKTDAPAGVALPESPPVIPPDATTLTHSASQAIMGGNSVACSSDGGSTTTANQYLRTFALDDFDIISDLEVTEVSFGIENLSGGEARPVTVNLYTLEGAFTYANLTPIGTATVNLDPQALTLATVPVTGVAPAGSTLVVEINPGDLSGLAAFFVGSNNQGQTAPSYLASMPCGLAEPTDVAAIGFSGMHIVMNVTGYAEVVDCELPGWVSASPLSGTVAPAGNENVSVTFDAAGLPAGDHEASLCIASNDPVRSLVVVPLFLEVEETPVIQVSPGSLQATLLEGAQSSLTLDIANAGLADLLWSVEPDSILYDNGPLVNSPGTGSGGADASVLQNASLGMTTLGAAVNLSGGGPHFRIADDFVVGAPDGWAIDEIVFYAYQTGSTITSTFTAVNYRIWDGPPDVPGSSIIYGDTTTNRMVDTDWTGIYRVTETNLGSTERPIMYVNAAADVHLAPGTYWLDWQLAGTIASGPWQPPITITGETTTGNALQLVSTGWQPFVDGGSGTPQGIPFTLLGDSVCDSPGDVPWLSATPTTGTTAPGGTDQVTVTLDATGMDEGEHTAHLCVFSNDPHNPVVSVPVHMTITSLRYIYLPITIR